MKITSSPDSLLRLLRASSRPPSTLQPQSCPFSDLFDSSSEAPRPGDSDGTGGIDRGCSGVEEAEVGHRIVSGGGVR
eukprot:1190757-Rhodomonas_salina.1